MTPHIPSLEQIRDKANGAVREPDIMDLNDWALTACPDVHRATWFLSDESSRYRILLQCWKLAQCPDLSTIEGKTQFDKGKPL